MAKKKDNVNDEAASSEESKGSKAMTGLIIFVIILIWLAVFGVLVKLNVGNFGSDILYPVLKDVPVISNILPTANSGVTDPTYQYGSMAEAVSRIQELEKQVASSNETGTASVAEINSLKAEVQRLKKFEDDQKAFAARVKKFDDEVVFNDRAPDVTAYKAYYEGIDPTNAAKIYKQVISQLQQTQKIKDQADIYSKMEPAAAAARLETMTGDLDLLAGIISAMQPSKSSQILANMSATTAAQITKKMTLPN